MNNIQKVREATQACLKRAQEMYGVDLSGVAIRFDLKGAAAGMAGYNSRFGQSSCYLRFNVTMINHNSFDHVLNDTVPHEVAHLVCFKNPRLGSGHNSGWARVCRELGGTGKTYHSEEVVYAKGKTYEYTCTAGTKHRFSEQRHRKIQRGYVYSLKRGGSVHRDCEYKVVGISGRPIATPTQKPKVTTMTTQAAQTTPAPVEQQAQKAPSKADQVRAAIARVKAQGLVEEAARQAAVDYAKAELGMKPALAKRYVQENWAKA